MKQHLLLFFLLVVGCTQAQQSFSNDRSQALFIVSQGDLLMRNGEPEKAIFKYTDAIVSDPNCSEAYMKRASANAKILRWEQAQKDYNVAVSLNPSSVIFYESRHKLYLLHHEYEKAIDDISIAVKLNPYSIHLKHEYISALILKGNINAAQSYCDSLLALDSADITLLLYRSYIYYVKRRVCVCRRLCQ
jgi:tetratricopeptide (TPR) repeat protein